MNLLLVAIIIAVILVILLYVSKESFENRTWKNKYWFDQDWQSFWIPKHPWECPKYRLNWEEDAMLDSNVNRCYSGDCLFKKFEEPVQDYFGYNWFDDDMSIACVRNCRSPEILTDTAKLTCLNDCIDASKKIIAKY